MAQIDSSKIERPNIILTETAQREVQSLLAHDFTLEGKGLRINISGKGCEGFTYQVGWDEKRDQDFELPLFSSHLLIDPFTAFYLAEGILDFQFDPQSDEEGFLVTNLHQKKFEGKFWREHGELTPPLIKEEGSSL